MTAETLFNHAGAERRRGEPRRRVLLAGKIAQANGITHDCMIRNLTEGGAQVRVAPGQILPNAEGDLEDTGLLEIEIPALADFPVGQVVPVRINPVITELGILELWMKHMNSDRRWKVEFQVRTE